MNVKYIIHCHFRDSNYLDICLISIFSLDIIQSLDFIVCHLFKKFLILSNLLYSRFCIVDIFDVDQLNWYSIVRNYIITPSSPCNATPSEWSWIPRDLLYLSRILRNTCLSWFATCHCEWRKCHYEHEVDEV